MPRGCKRFDVFWRRKKVKKDLGIENASICLRFKDCYEKVNRSKYFIFSIEYIDNKSFYQRKEKDEIFSIIKVIDE